jgi:hypothetical protein
MVTRFEKTLEGHREIRDKSRRLARSARMILVLSDGLRSSEELLRMVNGSSAADLALLLDAGLIAVVGGFGPDAVDRSARDTERASQQFAEEAASEAARDDAEGGLDYNELYDSLNALAKEQLGLFKGYRFTLEIERANGIDELREVARHFVLEVRKAKGESAAQMVRRALGLSS